MAMTCAEAGRKGGASSGRSRLEDALDRVRAEIPGLTDNQARLALFYGNKRWQAGHASGKRLGRRQGFAEANGEPARDGRHEGRVPSQPVQERLA